MNPKSTPKSIQRLSFQDGSGILAAFLFYHARYWQANFIGSVSVKPGEEKSNWIKWEDQFIGVR
ncbi:MAG: hypothetical protein DRJ13_17655 [Bacteroidetes bacterium]|nr:MAG: hypothetical protein DRJ13_17655 [Bacteroidota bacterium]